MSPVGKNRPVENSRFDGGQLVVELDGTVTPPLACGVAALLMRARCWPTPQPERLIGIDQCIAGGLCLVNTCVAGWADVVLP